MTSSTNQQSGSGSTPSTSKDGPPNSDNNPVLQTASNSSKRTSKSESEEVVTLDKELRGNHSTNKFDAILDEVVDTQFVDFKIAETWLRGFLIDEDVPQIELITDTIMDALRCERYPDAKVIQCELSDIGLLSSKHSRRCMRILWHELLDLQGAHKAKYRKASASSSGSSTTRISTSTSSSTGDDPYHGYYSHSYASAYSSHNSHNGSYYHANQLS